MTTTANAARITRIPTTAALILVAAIANVAEFGADAIAEVAQGTPTLRIQTTSDGYGRLTAFVHAGVTLERGPFSTIEGEDELAPRIEFRGDGRCTPAENARRKLARFVAVDKDVRVEWV